MLVKTCSYMSLLMMSGCSFIPFLKEHPIQIKATVEGQIKGHNVRCEKTLELGSGKWGLMCSINNDFDIKYRMRKLRGEETEIEFLVEKAKTSKVIATPTLIVNHSKAAKNTIDIKHSYFTIVAERIR